MTNVVIIGGGPGGYEAALVAAQLGGAVTLIERRGLGGAAVLTDVVPSKTLIATAEVMTTMRGAHELGLRVGDLADLTDAFHVDLAAVNQRVLALAATQSTDIEGRLRSEGVRLIDGVGKLYGTEHVVATTDEGEERLPADIILVATGTTPRELPAARPDGERILNWTQLYNLRALPERLIVVGSGVTGAEFASAYNALGADVVLVSSRHQVLPGEDDEAARVVQQAFERSGMTIVSRSRAEAAEVVGDEVVVHLADGRTITGSHCLMAVGSVPNTAEIGLTESGVQLDDRGYVTVDKVSRTTARGVYAAGDCTGVFALASVAAMQGRIAMWHSLGDAVGPLDLRTVCANVFTAPEIATVGVTQVEVDAGLSNALGVMLPLHTNPRAKMRGIHDGFVKVFCLPTTGIIVGGVVVAPIASELIESLSMAVRAKLTVDQLAQSFTVYPSLSGSIAEAGRRLHTHSAERRAGY